MISPELATMDGKETLAIFDEIQAVYAEAFPGYDLGDHRRRTERQARSAGFMTVTVRDGASLQGFAYGLPLGVGSSWWEGLHPPCSGDFVSETGARTFAVIDLAVLTPAQGQGLGGLLMRTLLASRTEERATLATAPTKTSNKLMYEKWGWRLAGQVPGGAGTTQPVYDLYIIDLR